MREERPPAPGTASAMNVHDVSTGVIPPGRSSPSGRRPRAAHPSLVALLTTRDQRRAETSYAASAFFEDDDFSDFFEESDDEDESLFESFLDSLFSPLSFDRSSSRFRRFVP
jgi:hypothetical protein